MFEAWHSLYLHTVQSNLTVNFQAYPGIVLSLFVRLLLGCGADLETEGLSFTKPRAVGKFRCEALDCLSLDIEKGACQNDDEALRRRTCH